MSDTVIMVAPQSPVTSRDTVTVWRRTAIIAMAFAVVVGIAMLFAQLEHKSSDPWRSPELLKLKEQLRAEPRNETLKAQIRELDLKLRQRYFHLLAFKASGIYLLCGGTALFLIAAAQVQRINKRPPMPKLNPLAAEQLAKVRGESRLAIVGCGVVVMATFLGVAFGSKSPLPATASELAKLFPQAGSEGATSVPADCATDEEMRANWPGFRGFDGSGVASLGVPPSGGPASESPKGGTVSTTFEAEHVLWKSPVPARGFNSPLVFGDRLFFTGGDAQKREVFCFDANTGELRWRKAVENVPGSPAQLPEIPEETGFCAATAATDGRRVYAMFANGDVAAISFEGQQVWARHLSTPKNMYGHATSLRTWRDRVIVQLDQGEPEDRLSKLIALDGRTGATVWEKARPVGASWATPIVVKVAGKPQVITLALPWVMAYEAASGAELWRAELLEGEVTPSPVLAGGLLNVVSPSQKVMAIRVDGSGDVTKTHVVWTSQDGAPDVTSPVSNGELVYTVGSGGFLTCLEAKDGKKIWEHDFEMETQASPAIVGNGLILLGTKGDVVVVEAGREFKELSRVKLDDAFFASPAAANSRVFLRGNKHVWCFGAKEVAHAH